MKKKTTTKTTKTTKTTESSEPTFNSVAEKYEIIKEDEIINSLKKGNIPSGIKVSDYVANEYKDTSIVKNEIIFVDEYSPDTWLMPVYYQNLDVYSMLKKKCTNEEEINRLNIEYSLYEKHSLINLLRFLMYFVDKVKEKNIMLGIGRGSSVASFILYLIGVHKVNPIKYNIDITDFFKEV